MGKTYELLKDLPNVKAGALVKWNSTETWSNGPYKGGRYGIWPMPNDNSCDLIFTCEDVETNPEWFRLVVPAEYEILSRFDYYERATDGELGAIKSIKRIYDNTIWTVGEKVNVNDILFDTIKGFEILNNGMNVKVGGLLIVAIIPLKDISKVPERIPLFKSFDGKEMFNGNDTWLLSEGSFIIMKIKIGQDITTHPFEGINKHFKYFSTEESAKEYALLNKKSFSVNDLITKFPIAGTLKDSLIKFAKEVNP